MMKNNKGITLISLAMYVVAFAIIAGIVGTITSFFYTNVTELRDSTNSLGEFEKFNATFLEEVKKKDIKVVGIENGGRKITFTSGTVISFEQTNEGIYTNNVKICEGVNECIFSIKEDSVKPTIRVYLEIGTDFAKTLEYVVNSNDINYEQEIRRVIITPNIKTWTSNDVIINFSCEDILDGYEIQYKIGDGSWTSGIEAIITTNNTLVQARLFNTNTSEVVGSNSITISNIDRQSPTSPTELDIIVIENGIEVTAIGGTDMTSGVAGYQYSIDGTNWSETIDIDESYIIAGLTIGEWDEYTLYARTVDKANQVSNVYNINCVPITFNIDEQQFYATNGMTWEEWCSIPKYNTIGLVINENSNIMLPSDGRLIGSASSEIPIEAYEEIFGGEPYFLEDESGFLLSL